MPEIILTEEQAKILVEARENVILRDEAGTVRIVSEPFNAIALANHHRRELSGIKEEGIPAEKIEAYMDALEAERVRLGGDMDEEYMEEFLERLEKAEAA
jgi:hypothetical protein